MYARTSFRGCVFLVIVTNFGKDMTDHKEKRMQKCVIRAAVCGGNLRAGVQGRAGGGADWDSKWRLSIDL